jgi:transcriptional regulator with XRE-family HTH domain
MHPFEAYRRRQQPPMTQTALAEKLGVTRAMVSLVESGKRRMSVDLMVSAAVRTGIAPALLRPDLASALRRLRASGE